MVGDRHSEDGGHRALHFFLTVCVLFSYFNEANQTGSKFLITWQKKFLSAK